MKRQLRAFVIILFLTILGVGGIFLGATTSKGVLVFASERYSELQTFSKVLNLVQEYYVEKVETKKLIQGAIKGMLGELDPHTNYMSKDVFKEFENETNGEFGGLGIEISVQNEILTVISPIEDTPAWKAGIKSGDKIVSVDGKSTKGLNLAEAAHLIKGEKGSAVKLGIFRKGFEKPKTFSITRGTVKIRSVKYTDFEDGYAYIRLTSFIENTSRDLKKKLKKHIRQNKKIKGLVIDLRNNPGGLLNQAVEISDMFLPKGVIVSTIGRDAKDKKVISATKDGTFAKFPLVILVNEYSASASEILAGALQDNSRALVMGQRSFGKGSVQSVVQLGDGSGLKMTVARYYTPNGISIQAKGITPDVLIDNVDPEAFDKAIIKTNAKREKDIKGHLLGDAEKKQKNANEKSDMLWFKEIAKKKAKDLSPKEKILKNDFQVMQAYKYLKAWKIFNKVQAM